MTPTNLRRLRRTALLASCASALALVTAPGAAHAQALASGFQGTPSVDVGAATITTGTNQTTINVGRQNTVVTWTPTNPATSGTIDFLPAGTTAAFTSTALSDYTVLNRILPGGTATIGINGQVTSTVLNPTPTPGPSQVPGGNVWFYTPNGFVIGPTATINVGGLLMTTNDLNYTVDPVTGVAAFADNRGFYSFSGADGSTASIVNRGTVSGAGADSYVAMIAPRIEQAGTVAAERSIGYFAGEEVTLLINNQGMAFTIDRGSGDANGIVHTGVTTGTASAGYGDAKTIIFAAIPKNEAMTMLLSGSIGYVPAANAYDDGSSIVLMADRSIGPQANVVFGEGNYRNRMTVEASGGVKIGDENTQGSQARSYSFADLGVTAASIDLVAGPGVSVSSGNFGFSTISDGGVAGSISVRALGASGTLPAGSITAPSLSIVASGNGIPSPDGLTGLAGQGGNVLLAADGGSISTDYLFLQSTGTGSAGGNRGGDGLGGTMTLRAGYGGSITATRTILRATGSGAGANLGGATDVSGVGRGGSIVIADSSTAAGPDTVGGLLTLGDVFLDAAARGGPSNLQTPSGEAFGGRVSITLDHASQTWNSLFATTEAVEGSAGGQGRSARDPAGGDIDLILDGMTLNMAGDLSLYADAVAGVNGPAGAFARGGTITVAAINGGAIAVSGNTLLSSTATVSGVGPQPASTPDLTGGTVNVTADAGAFSTTNLTVDISTYNCGATNAAGFSQAGTANLLATNGGTLTVAPPVSGLGGDISINATATGGDGPAANIVTGGTVRFTATTSGAITAQSVNADAGADATRFFPTVAGTGANVTGGAIIVDAVGGAISIANGMTLTANGTGGTGDNGGGAGVGGSITARVIQGGALSGAFNAEASGTGGNAAASGNGGIGRGGTLSFTTDATGTTSAGMVLSLFGTGKSGAAPAGTAGDAFGGRATLDVNGGTHSWSDITLSVAALGTGGTSPTASASSATGDAQGARFHLGGGATMTVSDITLDATALTSANGGVSAARGGSAALLVDGGASLTAATIQVGGNGAMLLGPPVIDVPTGGPFNGIVPADRQSTPSGIGGTASVLADGGTIATGGMTIDAIGYTGGALTTAGVARGGSATLGALNGGAVTMTGTNPPPRISAVAGGGEGPVAAHATGGTAVVYTAGGTITSAAGLSVNADGLAGPYAGQFSAAGIASNGFNAQGGSASVELRTGGTGGGITAPSITVSAVGQPNPTSPLIGPGGTGTGGSATLVVAQGALATGAIDILADGYGGQSAADPAGFQSFQSGPGAGGIAAMNLTGGTVTTTGLGISANGFGASGQSGFSTAMMSQASAGTGGNASLRASGGTLTNSGSLSIIANGFGGGGAADFMAGTGGNGAAGTGGTATLITPAGGAATLAITGPIIVFANGSGGNGGFGSIVRGAGGAGTGGAASARLADIAFTFAPLSIGGRGNGGAGTGPAIGTGGSASFILADTSAAAIGPRTLASLSLDGAGFDGAGAPSVGGATAFTAQVGNAGSALTITGDLVAGAIGLTGPAGNGFVGTVSGAPVAVGGALSIITPRDGVLTIVPGAAINVTGDITIQIGRTFTSSGLLTTAANASVVADGGISMTDLSAGGTTLLRAVGGPVSVSNNLESTGLVTAYGTSVDINSLGGLSFADADAIAGDLRISTSGDLDLVTVDATGAITLQSTGGTVHNTGAVTAGTDITYLAAIDAISDAPLFAVGSLTVDAGNNFSAPGTVGALGNVSLSAGSGLSLSDVQSGGTTLLLSPGGPVIIASLVSAGPVTAIGQSVDITGPGALTFADAQATAGDLQIATAGNLAVLRGSATGTVTLASSGGAISGAGPTTAGGAVSVTGATGIALGTLTSGGTTSLLGNSGPVTVTNLGSAGAVIARGTAVDIGSSGALTFADLDATAGNVRVQTAGNLAVNTVDATGSITLISTGGALNIGGALTGVGITLSSLANLSIAAPLATSGPISLTSTGGSVTATSPVTAGGALTVAGQTGITLGNATSGGATSLLSAAGPVTVTNLASAGAVTARGTAVDIASTGALTFADLDATAGNVRVQTAGNLAVNTVDATGSITLISTGGALGINGALTGVGITLSSLANLALTAPLATSGPISLTSTAGNVSSNSPISAGGAVAVTGATGIALGALTSGGTTSLLSSAGPVAVTNLTSAGAVTASGRSVDIGSTGALTFADLDATAGNVRVQTAGNLAVNTVDATGSITLISTGGALGINGALTGVGITLSSLANLALTAPLATSGPISLTSTGGSVSSSSPISAGGALAVAGQTGIALGTVGSGGATSLVSAAGPVTVTNLTSAGAVTASGRSVDIGSTGALTFADLDATAGNVRVQTAGNLAVNTVDATGSITLISTGGALGINGALTGVGITLSSLANLALTAPLATSGPISLTSTGGSVSSSSPISAGGALAVAGQTGITLGTVGSGGASSFASSGGNVLVTALTSAGPVTASGRAVDLRSPGSLTVTNAQATAGALSLQAAGPLTVGTASATGAGSFTAGGDLATSGLISGAGLTLSGSNVTAGGELRSSAALALTARRLLTIGAAAAGTSVTATVGDIAIAGGGRLGQRGLTGTLTITNINPASPMVLGGTGQSGQFSLDKAEAARLFADNRIAIVQPLSPTGTAGDVLIGDLAMAYGAITSGANVGAGGTIKVDAPGRVEVNGTVAITTVSASDTFSIDPTRIDVIAGTGAIALRDAAGAPLGILELQAGTIAVADGPTLSAIAAAPTFAAIAAALDRPAAPSTTGAYLQAGTINLLAADTLFIQNGGASTAFAARRGFLANALSITTSNPAPQISINGVIASASVSLFGLDTAQAVSINGVTASTIGRGPTITINGCAVGFRCAIDQFSFGGRSNDELEPLVTDNQGDPASANGALGGGTTGQLDQIERLEPLITPPLVDEPITGIGNDDLWQVQCDPKDDKKPCPARADAGSTGEGTE